MHFQFMYAASVIRCPHFHFFFMQNTIWVRCVLAHLFVKMRVHTAPSNSRKRMEQKKWCIINGNQTCVPQLHLTLTEMRSLCGNLSPARQCVHMMQEWSIVRDIHFTTSITRTITKFTAFQMHIVRVHLPKWTKHTGNKTLISNISKNL